MNELLKDGEKQQQKSRKAARSRRRPRSQVRSPDTSLNRLPIKLQVTLLKRSVVLKTMSSCCLMQDEIIQTHRPVESNQLRRPPAESFSPGSVLIERRIKVGINTPRRPGLTSGAIIAD